MLLSSTFDQKNGKENEIRGRYVHVLGRFGGENV